MTTVTTYAIRDERGTLGFTTDADGAERLSRAGMTVTAVTRSER
jgi:hypothetical protein